MKQFTRAHAHLCVLTLAIVPSIMSGQSYNTVTCAGSPSTNDANAFNTALGSAMSGTNAVLVDPIHECHLALYSFPPGTKLIGIPGNSIIAPYTGGGLNRPIILVNPTAAISGISIEGVTFDAAGNSGTVSSPTAAVLYFGKVSNLRFVNNVVLSSAGAIAKGAGIAVADSDGLIEGNDISGTSEGIDVQISAPVYSATAMSLQRIGGFSGPQIINNKIHDLSGGNFDITAITGTSTVTVTLNVQNNALSAPNNLATGVAANVSFPGTSCITGTQPFTITLTAPNTATLGGATASCGSYTGGAVLSLAGGGDGIFVHGPTYYNWQDISTTASYYATPDDQSTVTTFSSLTAAITAYLPALPATQGWGAGTSIPGGWGWTVNNTSTHTIYVAASGAATINGGASVTFPPGISRQIYTSDGVNWVASRYNNSNGVTYTVAGTDNGNQLIATNMGSAWTLPAATSGLPSSFGMGFSVAITNTSGSNMTISSTSYINATATPLSLGTGNSAYIRSDGVSYTACIDIGTTPNYCPTTDPANTASVPFPFPYEPHLVFPVLVQGNHISNVHSLVVSPPGAGGGSGNGIHTQHIRFVRFVGNFVENTDYSCGRATDADDITFDSNHCLNSAEGALFAEYSSQRVTFSNNSVNGAFKSGIECPGNYDFALSTPIATANGRNCVIIGNQVTNVGGDGSNTGQGWGIRATGYTLIDNNLVDHARICIFVGASNVTRNVVASHNQCIDSFGGFTSNATQQIGICVSTGQSTQQNNVILGNLIDLPFLATSNLITNCTNPGAASPPFGAGVQIRDQTIYYGNLGAPDDGSYAWVPDANQGLTCTPGGTGSYAQKRNGAWSCP